MDSEELFHLAEESIKTVSGIRHPKFWVSLKREQIREIDFQTVIGGADLLVRVVPVFSIAFERLLFQELLPFFGPFTKKLFEIFFRHKCGCSSDCRELLSGFKLWF